MSDESIAGEPYVFVSYAHADADFVYPESRRLIGLGYHVWYDERIRAGSDWRDAIAGAIENAAAVLLIVSPRSLGSAHCQKEVHHALEHKRPLLAVHIERTRMSGGLGFTIGNEQGLLRYQLDADTYGQQLQQWLSRHVGALSTGQRIGAERLQRRVAIVVSDLVFGADPPADLHELKLAFAEFCQRQLADFDGHTIDSFDGRCVTLFGLPDSFEDNAARAAMAAGALRDAFVAFRERVANLTDAPFELGVVLHSDIVMADRNAGSTVTGNGLRSVLRAAGHLREGGLYVTPASAERFCRDGRFSHAGTHVPSLRVLEQTPEIARRNRTVAAIADPPFAGRARELDALMRLLQRAEQGKGGVACVTGQAGIGKSRLARTFRERLGEQHMWLQISGLPQRSADALYPFAATFQRAWYIRPDDDPAQRMARAIAAVQRVGMDPDAARAPLADLLGLPIPAEHTAQSAEQRREALLNFLVDWFVALSADTTTILLVEDLHWLDPTSAELTLELAREALDRRLVVLITSRDDPGGELAELPALLRLPLAPLADDEAAGLLRNHLPDPIRSDALIAALIERADGLPLFLDELARLAVSSGSIEDIPATLEDLLNSRTNDLDSARPVIAWAAALGREFAYDQLARVVPVAAEALDAALAEMMSTQILYRRGIGRRRTFQFRHALLRDAAYQAVPDAERRRIHAAIADALLTDDSGREARQVAQHLRAAGRHDEAAAQFQQAAGDALQQSSFREALQDLDSALAELDAAGAAAPEQRFALHVERFISASAIAGYTAPQAQSVLEEARVLAHTMGEPAMVASFMQKLCFGYAQRGEVQTALTLARQIEGLGDDGQQRVRQRFVEAMGATSLLAGVPAAACEFLREGVDLARRWSDPHDLIDSGVFSLGFLGVAQALRGRLASAAASIDAALQLAARVNQPFSLACASDSASRVYLLSGDTQRTREAAVALITTSREYNLDFFAGMGGVLRGWARAMDGEVRAGRDEILASLAALEGSRSGRERTLHLYLLAERTGERFNLPQLLALQARLERSVERAEAISRDAIGLARAQHSELLELRALTSHLQHIGPDKRVAARLQTLLEQLTEAPDAADFVAARRALAGQAVNRGRGAG